jgi:DNA-binding SARP family transcriptional activator
MVEVRVFGGLEVRAAGAPLPLPADARARELLAWLALNPGRHPRSTLAGRLRPDVAEESARKTLRDAVYRLRGALGPGGDVALEATREHVGLVDVRVDAQEFGRLRVAGELLSARSSRRRARPRPTWVPPP